MILAFVDLERGEPDKLSLEALTFARALAAGSAEPLEAVVVGAGGRDSAITLGRFGASKVHLAADPRLDDGYAPSAWGAAVAGLIEEIQPSALLGPASDRGCEILAEVAARDELPLAANVTEAQSGDPFRVTRMRWGGSLLEEATLDGRVKLMTVAPHAVQPEEAATVEAPVVQEFSPSLADDDFRVRTTGRVEAAEGKISLADARVVVGGGRGVGSAEGFALLEELAGLLGGTVGVSRAVTSLGWRPHSDQVGQTGTRIAPDLYVACGISGAIQHMVGAKGAKHLLAINSDPEAPIMSKAEYAVIGDLHSVVSAIIQEIRKSAGSRVSS